MKPFATLAVFLFLLHAIQLVKLLWLGPGTRLFVGISLASVLPAWLTVSYLSRRGGSKGFGFAEWAVLTYLGYSICSVVLYLQPENPSSIEAFGYGVYQFVLPMACFFAARSLTAMEVRRTMQLVIGLNVFALLLGIVLHFTRPEFYTEMVLRDTLVGTELGDADAGYARMQSYLGSTAVGMCSGLTMLLVAITLPRPVWMMTVVSVCVMAGLLSYQRGATAGIALGIAVLVLRYRHRAAWLVLALFLLIWWAPGAIRLLESPGHRTVEDYSARNTDELRGLWGEFGMYGDRGYGPGLQYVEAFPMGVGLGGASSSAASAGLASWGQVADANFMRIMADLGIPGVLLFLCVLGGGAVAAGRRSDRLGWWGVLTAYCGVMLGTNTLDSYYVSHLFWLLLGFMLSGEVLPAAAESHGSKSWTKEAGLAHEKG